MRALPDEFDDTALIGVLDDAWGFGVEAIQYVAVGGGTYHWLIHDLQGSRRFVNVDDLDRKPWFGDSRESVFDGLRGALDTALALHRAGLDFVVAPIPTSHGETVRRIGPRYTIALLPFVDGQAGQFGHYASPAERASVVAMLAELHAATPVVRPIVGRIGLALPERRHLEAALDDVNQTWFGGPLSEPARRALATGAADVAAGLALADRLAAEAGRRCTNWVVTHGEPHAANVMRTPAGRHMLIDWDTVALAPPERDLWMVLGDSAAEATMYAELTGHQPDPVALDFFRLLWDLKDMAAFIELLRSPHRQTEDTLKAYEGLRVCVDRAATKR